MDQPVSSQATQPGKGLSASIQRLGNLTKTTVIAMKWGTIEMFSKGKNLDPKDKEGLAGHVAVVTGGGRGIGKSVVKKLLELGFIVVLGARDVPKVDNMFQEIIKKEELSGSCEVHHLDLKSLDSVRNFADTVLAKHRKIHVLINNAGIMMTPYEVTKDGFEGQFQVNYLSHFLLTNRLLPALRNASAEDARVRIVSTSSVAHYSGHLNFQDLNSEKMYDPTKAYCDSKLAQVVYSNYLNGQLARDNISVFSLHPGVIKTELYSYSFLTRLSKPFLGFLRSVDEGADQILFAALSKNLDEKGGSFLCNKSIQDPNPDSNVVEIQQKLVEASKNLCKVYLDNNESNRSLQ